MPFSKLRAMKLCLKLWQVAYIFGSIAATAATVNGWRRSFAVHGLPLLSQSSGLSSAGPTASTFNLVVRRSGIGNAVRSVCNRSLSRAAASRALALGEIEHEGDGLAPVLFEARCPDRHGRPGALLAEIVFYGMARPSSGASA
jgi:hypothetical protein